MAADKWIARTVGTLIAICVIIMFVSHLIAALVGLIGIFITESAVGCFSGRWYLRLNRRTDSPYLSFVATVSWGSVAPQKILISVTGILKGPRISTNLSMRAIA